MEYGNKGKTQAEGTWESSIGCAHKMAGWGWQIEGKFYLLGLIFLVCLCRENQEKVLSCKTSPQTMQGNPIFRFCCNWIGSVFLTSKTDSTILFTTPIGTVNLGEWILKMKWITISCNSQLLEDLASILSTLMVVHNYL